MAEFSFCVKLFVNCMLIAFRDNLYFFDVCQNFLNHRPLTEFTSLKPYKGSKAVNLYEAQEEQHSEGREKHFLNETMSKRERRGLQRRGFFPQT